MTIHRSRSRASIEAVSRSGTGWPDAGEAEYLKHQLGCDLRQPLTRERSYMTTTATASVTGTYAIDPAHSRIGFVARHAMVTKVRGSFDEFKGSGYFDAENPAS